VTALVMEDHFVILKDVVKLALKTRGSCFQIILQLQSTICQKQIVQAQSLHQNGVHHERRTSLLFGFSMAFLLTRQIKLGMKRWSDAEDSSGESAAMQLTSAAAAGLDFFPEPNIRHTNSLMATLHFMQASVENCAAHSQNLPSFHDIGFCFPLLLQKGYRGYIHLSFLSSP